MACQGQISSYTSPIIKTSWIFRTRYHYSYPAAVWTERTRKPSQSVGRTAVTHHWWRCVQAWCVLLHYGVVTAMIKSASRVCAAGLFEFSFERSPMASQNVIKLWLRYKQVSNCHRKTDSTNAILLVTGIMKNLHVLKKKYICINLTAKQWL